MVDLGGGLLGSIFGGFSACPEILKWLDKKTNAPNELLMSSVNVTWKPEGRPKVAELRLTGAAIDVGDGCFHAASTSRPRWQAGWCWWLLCLQRPTCGTYWVLLSGRSSRLVFMERLINAHL